jgi:hypothetical protein
MLHESSLEREPPEQADQSCEATHSDDAHREQESANPSGHISVIGGRSPFSTSLREVEPVEARKAPSLVEAHA